MPLTARATFSPAHPLVRRDVPLARARAFPILSTSLKGAAKVALYCAQYSHPPNPERAETRSCPKRAHSYRARSASKKGTWSPSFHLSSFCLILSRAVCLVSHCACRTSTFRACAFHEHRRPTGCPAHLLTALSTGSYNLLILLPVTD